jgi:hypothetical protein
VSEMRKWLCAGLIRDDRRSTCTAIQSMGLRQDADMINGSSDPAKRFLPRHDTLVHVSHYRARREENGRKRAREPLMTDSIGMEVGDRLGGGIAGDCLCVNEAVAPPVGRAALPSSPLSFPLSFPLSSSFPRSFSLSRPASCVEIVDTCGVTDVGITTPVKFGSTGGVVTLLGAVPVTEGTDTPAALADGKVPVLPWGERPGDVLGSDGGPGTLTDDGPLGP